MIKRRFLLIPIIALCAFMARATDVYYSDTHAISENGRYKVVAKSPDNQEDRKKPFAKNFAYTLTDLKTRKVLWGRKQGAREASPQALYVDNDGWVAIRTGWDELIFVSPAGEDTGKAHVLKEAFTEDEREQYVWMTTAGPRWSENSLWYFIHAQQRRLFVIRPWWGRRVIADVEKGSLIPEDQEIAAACLALEKDFVMRELAQAVKTREKWEKEECCEAIWPILKASYLAGRLPVPDVLPFLEELQDVAWSGSSTSGGFGEAFRGEVNPYSYRTFTLRQVVQLSLRRLGKKPRSLPVHQFAVQYENYKKNHPYKPKALSVPREDSVGAVKAGMKGEQVLDLLGSPDFVEDGTWEYDMDSAPPFSLILKWDASRVVDVQRKSPVLWREGLTRDEQIVR